MSFLPRLIEENMSRHGNGRMGMTEEVASVQREVEDVAEESNVW